MILETEVDSSSGLYLVNLHIDENFPEATALITTSEQAILWHRRLAHASGEYLGKLFAAQPELPKNVKFDDISMAKCESCCKAKQVRQAYDQTRHRAKSPLELIQTDIIGPLEESVNGEKYLITFLDDYSHCAVTVALHQRSDVAEHFKKFERLATAKFNQKISTIRLDNAPEFVGGDFRDYCNESEITLQFAEPYEHQHNGTAESWNRTIMERTRALLYDAKLPEKFWSYSAYAATFILNRSPTSTLKFLTPFEKWNCSKLDLRNLRVFGCVARKLVPYEKRTKLQPKSENQILIGYSDTGYLLLDTKTLKASFSSQVLFEENMNYADIGNIELLVEENSSGEIDNGEVDNNDTSDNSTQGVALAAIDTSIITYEEAMASPERECWIQAIDTELAVMRRRGVWEKVKRPVQRKANIIDMVWVCRKKRHADGSCIYRARLCARGFLDKNVYSPSQTYAPVIKLNTLRAVLSLACSNEWEARHVDISNAYLYADLEAEIFSLPPKGSEDYGDDEYVYLLKKAIYGLDTSAKDWNDTLVAKLKKMRFIQSAADPCVFHKIVNGVIKCIIAFYVDDMIITGSCSKEIEKAIIDLSEEFELKDLGEVRRILGIQVKRSGHVMELCQSELIEESLKTFGMSDWNPVSTPIERGIKIDPNKPLETKLRSMIGKLLYIASGTRPDIQFAVNFLSRYLNQSTPELEKLIKRIFRYLKGTKNVTLRYYSANSQVRTCEAKPILEIWVDSDFAGDCTDRKSTSGVVTYLHGNVAS